MYQLPQYPSRGPLLRLEGGTLRRKDNDGGGGIVDARTITSELARIGSEVTRFAGEAHAVIKGHDTRLKDLEDEFVVMRPGGGQCSAGGAVDLVGPALQKAFGGEGFQALREGRARSVAIALPTGWHQKAITTGTLGTEARLAEIYGPARLRTSIRSLLPTVSTGASSISFPRETAFTNAAAVVAEGALKPESNMLFELLNQPVVTIAHWIRASKQVLDDLVMLQRFIDSELRYGLALAEEAQLLLGSGVGGNLQGLYTAALAFAAPVVVTGPTAIDTIKLALGQLRNLGYTPSAVVLHPNAWLAMSLLKDGESRYLIGSPTTATVPNVEGVPAVLCPTIDPDAFMVGDLPAAAVLVDRELANVVISSEDADNFVKNLVTIRAEERVTLGILRPSALVKGEFPAA